MAVYGASLERLQLAAERVRQGGSVALEKVEGRESASAQGGDPALRGPAHAEAPAEFAGTVNALLNLPKAQLEALLSEWGDSGGKALLVLIHRLAVLEEEVARLADRRPLIPSFNPPASKAFYPVARPKPIVYDAGKSDLLEQVFQKNLALRQSGMR